MEPTDAERAASAESALEKERSARALAEGALAAMAAELAALRLAAPLAALPPAPPPLLPKPLPRPFASVEAAIASGSLLVIGSPAKAPTSIQRTFARFDAAARPLSPALVHLSAAPSLELWHQLPANALLQEESGYPIATSHVPAWVH
jgi:hypothetical protein